MTPPVSAASSHREVAARPHHGECRTCPRCAHLMRFDEQFSLKNGTIWSDPAWLCLNRQCALTERL
jgi:hypothetical protein